MSQSTAELFACKGLRCTRQRKAIYDALAASREHPTADELYRRVVLGDAEGLSLATVYNTLEAFCRAGLAQKLAGAGENGSARYDAVRGNHLHLRCQQTGQVQDVPDELSQVILEQLPAEVLRQLEATLGFKVEQVQIELVGRFASDAAPTPQSAQ